MWKELTSPSAWSIMLQDVTAQQVVVIRVVCPEDLAVQVVMESVYVKQ